MYSADPELSFHKNKPARSYTKKPIFQILATIIMSLLFSFPIIAEEYISLDPSTSHENISLYVDIFEDPEGLLQLDDVIHSRVTWHRNTNTTMNFGYTTSTYWYRFLLKNVSDQPIEQLLAIEYPMLDKIDLYFGSEIENVSHSQFGRSLPFNTRPIKNKNFLQVITLEPNQQQFFYLKIKTESAMQIPLSIWTQEAFIEQQQHFILVQGIYFGMTLIMLFYNLFLFISIRDKTYLAYIGSVFFVILVQSTIRGFSYQYLFPDFPLIEKYHLPIVVNMSGAMLALFSIMFLELKIRSRKLYHITRGFIVLFIILAILTPFLGYSLSIRLSVVFTMLLAVVSSYSGVYIWINGFKPANYFSAAYITFFIATIMLSLNKLGFIERNFFTENAQEIGSGLEVVLLSFALAYRITLLKLEKEQAQNELTFSLENKVTERTQELSDAMSQLSQLNTRLKVQNMEDSLTGVFNRRCFDKTITNEWGNALRSETPVSVIMADIDHFKGFNDKFGHSVGDDCLKLVGQSIKTSLIRRGDIAFRYGGEEFAVILPFTDLQGAAKVGELIRSSIENQTLQTSDNKKLSVTISIGIASVIPTGEDNLEGLIHNADEALYSAKKLGRNRVELFRKIKHKPTFIR